LELEFKFLFRRRIDSSDNDLNLLTQLDS